MTMHFRDLAEQAMSDGTIAADELLALRRSGWADGRIDPAEAEALFVANDHLSEHSPEWTDFFVEALTEFVVNGGKLRGYIDQDRADWLIGRIDHDCGVETMAELELLVRVLEVAISAPARLKAYALEQIEAAVLTGEGPTRHGGLLDPGCISGAEVLLLRRLIFAAGGDRPAAVSRAEAELLFRIKDATRDGANSAQWQQLFVQGVANFLQGFGGSEPLAQARAQELESFMSNTGAGIGGFLGRMLKSDVNENFASLLSVSAPARDIDAEVEAAEAVTETEELWLQDLLDADEELDELEKALLAFLSEEEAGQAA